MPFTFIFNFVIATCRSEYERVPSCRALSGGGSTSLFGVRTCMAGCLSA